MHELSIAQGLVDVVTAEATRLGATRVRTVYLAVGRLSGVEAGALEFSYDLVTEGTLLAGSRLIIDDVPIAIHCVRCDAEHDLPGVNRFRCPVCDTPSADIRRGRELDLTRLELDEPDDITSSPGSSFSVSSANPIS
ncbi:MAG: hydrogenase maturation nickel metallochaperone HypA [Gemmatimonadaceae bacterium]|jgi:hydrogenase nickel incorporation protein HypA/HybF|uniref:hydrogenase maturation nickel metallochaperone HypA n=1 Tax=Gemmatimonas sp. UBA7669 TaxID=1946568 RepID=UPI0025B84F0E|nr:hydrogenase maturation nickel metallochaperone HypA [Gemmatimonas sp. UBA7669]MBA3917243.1 hydrogenase maturation nickel metallochaperone HypA [Gemmatimonas sp.]MBX9855380.1 hydrogenase maturation nickel metallochaperone HypA [Gemmatimonadaceae bacterium]